MVRVAIVGAGGGIGQPLSLLIKLKVAVTGLNLIDVAPVVKGVAADLSHIPTPAQIKYFINTDPREGLVGADIVLVPAGIPRKPGMTRDDLFSVNAKIVKGIAEAVADSCPNAFVGVISNPVNSTVPIFVETFKAKGLTDFSKIFGVTTLDLIRAATFVSEKVGGDVSITHVPVVGGHAGTTIVPLFSQITPARSIPEADLPALVDRTQNGGTEVVEAKDGAGSATLSMAQAAAVFTDSLLTAIAGGSATVCAYVLSPLYASAGVSYFASPVVVGATGVTAIPPLPSNLSEAENAAIQHALEEIKASVEKGEEFVRKN